MSILTHRAWPRVLMFGILLSIAAAPAVADDDVATQIIVRLVPDVTIDEVNADYGTTTIAAITTMRTYLLQLPEACSEETCEESFEMDPRIENAELNDEADLLEPLGGQTQSFYFNVPPDDFTSQFLWDRIGLPAAHTHASGAGVIVALLDTGLDTTHELMAPVSILPGYNFIDDNTDVADVGNGLDDDGDSQVDELVGHGTFLAGLVATIAPDASILPVRILDSDGASNAFLVAQGIYYARDQGAHVINLSLGSLNENEIIGEAVEEARAAGILVTAAAGNLDASSLVVYPAGFAATIAVAATDIDDHKTTFSNFGDYINISAPGSMIVSAVPGNAYGEADGTSMSAAVVAGVAALVRSANPLAGADEFEQALFQSAADLDLLNPAYAGLLGQGRIDAAAAIDSVLPPTVAADLNNDEIVNMGDLLIILADWGQGGSPADLDQDGLVGISDLLLLLSAWS